MSPLTKKGSKIMHNMQSEYGAKKGKQVFYASKNAGKIHGVDKGFYSHMERSGYSSGNFIDEYWTDDGADYVNEKEELRETR